jgi:hypothetical protein
MDNLEKVIEFLKELEDGTMDTLTIMVKAHELLKEITWIQE